MGQQQLLLLILGVVIVGIAVAVGIQLFRTNATQSNRDALVNDMGVISAQAQAYWRKPTAMGGGGRSFVKFDQTIPAAGLTNTNGTITVGSLSATSITITGVGVETGNDGSTQVKGTLVITMNTNGDPTSALTVNN